MTFAKLQHKTKKKMSDDISLTAGLLDAFEKLELSNESNFQYKQNEASKLEERYGSHDLSCRVPQSAYDTVNSDDTGTNSNSESDVIVVVDSSCASTEVSFLWTPNSSISGTVSEPEVWSCGSYVDSEIDTIPETASEISDIDINASSAEGVDIMDKLESTPVKRNHGDYPIRNKSCITRLDEEVVNSPMITTTRSGRTVRARIDHKFDYSSEQRDDETDDSDDPDDPDFNEVAVGDADKDDRELTQAGQTMAASKLRRISMRSNCCSSSDAGSIPETDVLYYLDLSQPVAIVGLNPTTDDVECDSDLKMRLKKFLGLVAPQRRLYNPMANFELEDNHRDEDEPQRSSLWTLITASNSGQPSNVTMSPEKEKSSPLQFRPKAIKSEISNDLKILLIDDMVLRANANYFDSQTPQHIKEPIDLSGLPSKPHRALICQSHKFIISQFVPYTGVYNFVNSLKSTTPLNMCHPIALSYRKRDFETCKASLSATLFNMLNHMIFYCGLHLKISWKASMSTDSATVRHIKAGGQRASSIVLWRNIKQSGLLVKALLHEMCHAAAFVYHGETGHGDHCRKWAYRAKSLMPELPEISDCKPSYKYTCLLCRGRSFGNMKFENEATQLRCHYCQFEVNVEPCDADDFHNLSLTDQLVTPYKEFVRANYLKCEQSSHSAKMRVLNVMYKEHQQTANS